MLQGIESVAAFKTPVVMFASAGGEASKTTVPTVMEPTATAAEVAGGFATTAAADAGPDRCRADETAGPAAADEVSEGEGAGARRATGTGTWAAVITGAATCTSREGFEALATGTAWPMLLAAVTCLVP